MSETVHIDLIAKASGHEIFLGHEDVDLDLSPNPSTRFRQLATVLMTKAWALEERADEYEHFQPRCLETQLGDRWFEVVPGKFQDASSQEEAEALFIAGSVPVALESLQSLYPDLKEVA